MANHNKITTEEIEIICSLKYNSNQLSQKLGRSRATIYKIAKQNNITLPFILAKRKYMLDETAFDRWSPDMAYWLGFIYADGSLSKVKRNSCTLNFSLQARDSCVLENLKWFLKSDYKIYFYKTKVADKEHDCCRLSVSSAKIFDSLCKLGLSQAKTFRIQFPTDIPDELISHFIRGYFDGDGHIITIQPKISTKLNLSIGFTGQHFFLESIKNQINKALNTNFGGLHKSKNGNFSQLVFTGIKSSLPIALWMYNESNEKNRLNRKYIVFKEYDDIYHKNLNQKRSIHPKENIYRGNTKLTWNTVKEIRRKHSDGIRRASLAREYGVDFGTINAIITFSTWKEPEEFYIENNY